MICFNIPELLSLLVAVKYASNKSYRNGYLQQPRPCHNIVFMLEGESVIETQNETIHLQPKQILYIPKGTTYISNWHANPKVVFHSIHFNFTPNFTLFENKDIPIQIIDCSNFDELYNFFNLVNKYQYEKTEKSFFAVSAFFSLCGHLFKNVKTSTISENNNPVFPAIQYLKSNLSANCSIESLAKLCFLSPSRFHFLFKKYTGCSPILYKNKLLIEQAAQTLLFEKDTSIECIAERYGFTSAIFFRRLFKQITGKTPTQYRKEKSIL